MRLSGRLDRLERKLPAPECPECGGRQPIKLITRGPGEPDPEHVSCPGCGKYATLLVVTFNIDSTTDYDLREG